MTDATEERYNQCSRALTKAKAKLDRISALHRQDPDRHDRSVCVECTRWLRANSPEGSDATAVWPCPTALIILDGSRGDA